MRRIAVVLVTMLTGSFAAAQPWPGPYDPPLRYDRRPSRWQELLVRSTDQPGVEVVLFQWRGGRLGLIRIAPIDAVEEIVVEYDRRPSQVYPVDRYTRRRGEAVIEVDRSARIRQIVIYSRSSAGPAYGVWGA